jgi:hypothetical protein
VLKHLVNFTLILVFLSGCSTLRGHHPEALLIEEVDWPISEIRQVAGALLPAGQRAVSPNGREMQSRHFLPDRQGGYRPAGDALERYFAHIMILGDRRPYKVEILVTHEKRVLRGNNFTYVITGYDKRLARELERKIRAELTKRREDRNIIDDFRVY